MSDTWNPERGDTTRDNADRTGVDRGDERMSDEDFGADSDEDTFGPDTVGPDTVSPDTVSPDTGGPDPVSPDTVSADTVPIQPEEHIDTGLRRQDTTVLDEHPTNTRERIDGIVEQTRDDMLGRDREEITELLRERFRDAGIEVRDDELESMAVAISRDRTQLPEGTFEAYREQVDPE